MDRQPIESKTGLCGIGYDSEAHVLELEFKSRKPDVPNPVYQYADFTPADFDAFMGAESKGSHFLRAIKPTFKCTKLEPPKPEEDSNAASGA